MRAVQQTALFIFGFYKNKHYIRCVIKSYECKHITKDLTF